MAPGLRRTSNLTDAELTKLLTALDGESEAGFHLMAHWFLLILLTAQRPGEVATMQWADLDLEAGWWNVRTSKNGDPIHAALSPVTVSVLHPLRTWSECEHARLEQNCASRRGPRALSPFVFPAGCVAVNRDSRPIRLDRTNGRRRTVFGSGCTSMIGTHMTCAGQPRP